MDNKNPSLTKLSGLRTFAKDQERNTSVTVNETPVSVAPVVTVVTPPKLTSIDREIRKTNKGEKDSEPIPATKVPEIPTPAPRPIPISEEIKKSVIKENITVAEKSNGQPTTIKSEAVAEDKNRALAQGAIITDTKRARFKLFPSIIATIKSWFTSKPQTSQPKETPKYTVPEPAPQREATQEPAWQTSEITPTEHNLTQEEIKQDQQEEVTGKEQETKTIWTPNTETGFLLLEDSASHIKNVKVVPRTNFYTSQREIVVDNLNELSNQESDSRWNTGKTEPTPAPKVIEPAIPTPAPKPIIKPIPEVKSEPVIEAPKVIEPAPLPPTIVETPSLPPIDRPDPIPENRAPITKTNEEHKDRESLLLQTSTNTLSFIISVIILAILIITGVGSSLFSSNTEEKSPEAKNYSRVLNADLRLIFQPMVTKASLIDRINLENRNSSTDINQFVFVTSEDNNDQIKPSNLLNYLEIKPPTNFTQSISDIYFGSLYQENPFIIFKNTDSVTAKGGMLAWETSMRNDLSLILKLGTDLSTSTESNIFIDGMIGGMDVRVLKSGNGEDEIVYGFVNRDTVIITESSNAFGRLLELIQP
ncbi:MAG: hypothetical protein KBC78_00735 [Candidatus Pacebacteria bacterium]|nr:hypothetical protein [Candidatus Paceibacterota bacterium]